MTIVTPPGPLRVFTTGAALALACILPAVAADALPLSAVQKKNLGITTAVAAAGAESPALTYPAQVALPPASV